MNEEKILKILKETDYVRTGGSPEEMKCAEYLRKCCNELEVETRIEDFEVQMSQMKKGKWATASPPDFFKNPYLPK